MHNFLCNLSVTVLEAYSLCIYFLNIVTGYLTLLKISTHELRLISVFPCGLLVAGVPGSLAVVLGHTLFFFFFPLQLLNTVFIYLFCDDA